MRTELLVLLSLLAGPAAAQTLPLTTPPCVLGTTSGTCRDAALALMAEQAAQATANAAVPTSKVGVVNGVAGLGAGGLVPTAQLPPLLAVGTTSGTARDAALALSAEQAAQSTATAAQTAINALSAKVPSAATSLVATMYASTCSATVNSSTPTSTFCAVATDATSATKRTYPANTLTVGRSFKLEGGGTYTVPAANGLAADIRIMVGSSAVMTVTTPAAPIGTNQGVEFYAWCTVRTSTTINCHGMFQFVVAATAPVPISFTQTGTFTPGVDNVIDVTGDWNGTTTTQSTVITQAVLYALN